MHLFYISFCWDPFSPEEEEKIQGLCMDSIFSHFSPGLKSNAELYLWVKTKQK